MRRALLIGCQTGELVGVHHDLEIVDDALALPAFRFERRVIQKEAATRDGILAALRRLIDDSRPEDTVLLYYSGHGGLVPNPAHRPPRGDGSPAPALAEPATYQYIVPNDHRADAFRGIFRAELSALVAALTAVTRNVTVVLDCCHSSGITMADPRGYPIYRPRGLEVPKRVPLPWAADLAAHITWLKGQGYDLSAEAGHIEGNPYAVRLAACKASQRAHEYTDRDGRSGGLLTQAFVRRLRAIDEAGGEFPDWIALGMAIDAEVREQIPGQHPEVSGPHTRRLFGVDAGDRTDIFAFAEEHGQPRLRGGWLHGIRRGDRFFIMPLEAGRPDRALALAEAEALDVEPAHSGLRLAPFPGRPPIPAGARAFRVDARLRRHPIRVAGDDPSTHATLLAAIAASPRLRPADDQEPALATVRAGPALALLDAEDRPLRHPHALADAPDAIPDAIAALERLARASDLETLESGTGPNNLSNPPTISWGRVRGDRLEPLAAALPILAVGERIYVTVATPPRTRPLYVSILIIEVDRAIRRLTAEAEGAEIFPGESRTFGADAAGQVRGVALRWSKHVPKDMHQPVTLVIVSSDLPLDLGSLTISPGDPWIPRSGDELLRQEGRTRRDTTAATSGRALSFHVQRLSLLLAPPTP